MSHYDLGEIRTETAIRPMSPEKKERLGVRGNKNASETPRRRIYVYLLFEFLAITTIFSPKFLNNEFALAN